MRQSAIVPRLHGASRPDNSRRRTDRGGLCVRAAPVRYSVGASELVAIDVARIIEVIDPEARLSVIPRSKGDPDGEGTDAPLERAGTAFA